MRFGKPSHKKKRSKTKHKSSFHPKMEQLEDRRLLAGDAMEGMYPQPFTCSISPSQSTNHSLENAPDYFNCPTSQFAEGTIEREEIVGDLRVTLERIPSEAFYRGYLVRSSEHFWKFNLYQRNDQGTPEDQSDDSWSYKSTLAEGDHGSPWTWFQNGKFDYSITIEDECIFLWISDFKYVSSSTTNASFSPYILESSIHIFEKGDGWDNPQQTILTNPTEGITDSEFGFSFDVKGTKLLIGDPREDSLRGAAYLYDGSQGWSNASYQKIMNPNSKPDDNFGESVIFHEDYFLIGAPQTGRAKTPQPTFIYSISLLSEIDQVAHLEPNHPSGTVYLYSLSDRGLINSINNPDATQDGFGTYIDVEKELIIIWNSQYTSSPNYQFKLSELIESSSFPFLTFAAVKSPTLTGKNGETPNIPDSDSEVSEWDNYYLELYLQIPEGSVDEISEITFHLDTNQSEVAIDMKLLSHFEWLESYELLQDGDNSTYQLFIKPEQSTLQPGQKILLSRFLANTDVKATSNYSSTPSIVSYEIKTHHDTFSAVVHNLSPPTKVQPVRYDINDDDKVGLTDLLFVLRHLGEKSLYFYPTIHAYKDSSPNAGVTIPYISPFGSTNSRKADINRDGHVNLADLSQVLSHFGEQELKNLTFREVTLWDWCGFEIDESKIQLAGENALSAQEGIGLVLETIDIASVEHDSEEKVLTIENNYSSGNQLGHHLEGLSFLGHSPEMISQNVIDIDFQVILEEKGFTIEQIDDLFAEWGLMEEEL